MSVIIYTREVHRYLEVELLKYKIVRKFLTGIKKEFRGGDEKLVKVVELKRLEQESKIIKEFV